MEDLSPQGHTGWGDPVLGLTVGTLEGRRAAAPQGWGQGLLGPWDWVAMGKRWPWRVRSSSLWHCYQKVGVTQQLLLYTLRSKKGISL